MDTSATLVIPFILMVVPHMRLRTRDGRILSVCGDFGIVSLCLVDSVDSFKRDHVLRFSLKLFFNNLTLFYCVLSFNLFLRLIIAINLITQRIVTTFRKKRMPKNVFYWSIIVIVTYQVSIVVVFVGVLLSVYAKY